MGAWGTGIFDDDTAYDFADEIKADPRSFFCTSFSNAIEADYLEYDACHAVTVSAAYIDNLLNGTTYRTDSHEEADESNVNRFRSLRGDLEVADLKAHAVEALAKVIGDKSELDELWRGNEELYPSWRKNIEDLIARLK
jgi:hypothetical protein